MNIQQNNSRFLFIPISHRLVTMFIVPVISIMRFLLCNRLQILSESYQLPLKQSCQYCTSRHIFVWQITAVACKVQTTDVFFPESLHSTFWHYKSQPERRKFLSQFKIYCFIFCNQNIWHLQQQDLSIQFWQAIKNNDSSPCCFRDLFLRPF